MDGKNEVSIEVVGNGGNDGKGLVVSHNIADVFLLTPLGCKVVTERSYQKQISYFLQELGGQPLSNLKVVIEAFVGEEKASIATRRLRKYALVKYFRTVVENPLEKYELVDFIQQLEIPKMAIKTISDERYLTKEQVIAIREIKTLTKKQRAVFDCLVESGLRASELTGIKITDIKPSIKWQNVSVIRVLGKGNKVRDVYLNNAYISQAREAFKGSTYLFEGFDRKAQRPNGKPLSHHSLYSIVQAIGKKAGITREKTDKNGVVQRFKNGKAKVESALHPHMLRHTFATLQLTHGGKKIKAISRYLGHSKTAITEDFYIHDSIDGSDQEDIY